ncbi:GFA family protein [Sphingomicrobium nitratireducens]|uniref:GFA family protein n=1 Tax=Sphingomicrobium nitratireducens TaxID=2964666 RepID=UPI00223F1064|nr:GFA family protein [Sphingomicrobium nitratireducens]
MQVTGRCFCEDIEYEAEIDPALVGVCHCRDCQVMSGSAFRMVGAIDPSTLRFTRGQPTTFDKTADSGGIRRMLFCGRCGTHLFALPGNDSATPYASLRVSTSDQFDRLPPKWEVYCCSKVSWLEPLDGAVQCDRMPPSLDA